MWKAAHLILLHFARTALCTNWRFAATLCWVSLLAPFSQLQVVTRCLCMTLWQFWQSFNLCHCHCTCYGDLWYYWYNCLGVPWTLPMKEGELVEGCMCFDCSTTSSPFLGPPYSQRHNKVEIRPINSLTVISKRSSERSRLMSLTLQQMLEIIKLTEEALPNKLS